MFGDLGPPPQTPDPLGSPFSVGRISQLVIRDSQFVIGVGGAGGGDPPPYIRPWFRLE